MKRDLQSWTFLPIYIILALVFLFPQFKKLTNELQKKKQIGKKNKFLDKIIKNQIKTEENIM